MEAFYERSPIFLKKFVKNKKDSISDGKPNVFCVKDFALCMHIESIYCEYNPTNHYQILFDVSEYLACFIKNKEPCSAPCLFTALRFSSADTLAAKKYAFQSCFFNRTVGGV